MVNLLLLVNNCMKTLREYLDQLDEISRRDFLKGAGAVATIGGIHALNSPSTDTTDNKNIKTGCQDYASDFSCDYIENKATYDVYYWKNLDSDADSNEVYIGQVVGLDNARNLAINYHEKLQQSLKKRHPDHVMVPWSDRMYIGMMLGPNGERQKHRYLGITKKGIQEEELDEASPDAVRRIEQLVRYK